MISSDLTFSLHIQNTVAKSQQMCGYILRTFSIRSPDVMITLFKSLIQPHLDYCVQLWFPHKIQDMQKLEAIQRSFTSRIAGLSDSDYWARLKKLNLYSVQRRYERYIAIYIWKVLEKFIVPPESEEIVATFSDRNGRTCVRSHLSSSCSAKLKTLQHNSLSPFGTRVFNTLPRLIRDFTGSLESFKKMLDCFLQTLPDEPNVPGYKSMLAPSSNSIIDQLQYQKNMSINFGCLLRSGPASSI